VIIKVKTDRTESPQITLINTALESSKNIIGAIKVRAKTNFDSKVAIVASQIDLMEYLFWDSWET